MPEDIQELARRLQKSLEEALASNENLGREREFLITRVKEAEDRSIAAERKVAEIEEKIDVLETLRSESYQKAVTELFDVPSKKSARLTMTFAIASILVTLVLALLTTIYSRKESAKEGDRLLSLLESRFLMPIEKPPSQAIENVAEDSADEDFDLSAPRGSTEGESEFHRNSATVDLPSYKIDDQMTAAMYQYQYYEEFVKDYSPLLDECASRMLDAAKEDSNAVFTVVAYADRDRLSEKNCKVNADVSGWRARMFTRALRTHRPEVSKFLPNEGRFHVCTPPPGIEDPRSPEARRIALVLGDVEDCGCPYKKP